jgi:hypothetical protein
MHDQTAMRTEGIAELFRLPAEPLVRRVGCDRLGLPSDHISLIP